MPEAIPDTVGMPFPPNALPKSLAIRIACGVAWRLPTMAAEGLCSSRTLPRKNKTGGAVSPCVSISGKSSS